MKLEKKVYQLTDEGKALLNEWIRTPTNELPVNRDEFVLKLYFVKDVNDPMLREIIEQQRDLHEEKRAHLLARQERIFPTRKEQEENYGHYLILSHAINRETEYANWLTSVLEEQKRQR